MKEEKRDFLRSEIEHKGIYRVEPNHAPIPAKAPANVYTWQFYLRRCLFNPKFVSNAAELLVDELSNKDVQIAACEDAGVPLGLAMSMILDSPMISIKKSRKSYGLFNFTEGLATGKPLLLVDDLAGSGKTFRDGVYILNAFNLPISNEYVALINKTSGTHTANYLKDKQLVSLFTCDDFAMTWNAYVEKYNKRPNFGAYY